MQQQKIRKNAEKPQIHALNPQFEGQGVVCHQENPAGSLWNQCVCGFEKGSRESGMREGENVRGEDMSVGLGEFPDVVSLLLVWCPKLPFCPPI